MRVLLYFFFIMFESEEDSYVTSTDYSQDYPIDDLPAPVSTLPSLPAHSKYHSIDSLNSDILGEDGKNVFFAMHLNADIAYCPILMRLSL